MPEPILFQSVESTSDREKYKKTVEDAYNAYLLELCNNRVINKNTKIERLSQAETKREFSFQNKWDADEFFLTRAKENVRFLFILIKPQSGPYYFSDGDGHLYKGKLSQQTVLTCLKEGSFPTLNTKDRRAFRDALKKNQTDKIDEILKKQEEKPEPGLSPRL